MMGNLNKRLLWDVNFLMGRLSFEGMKKDETLIIIKVDINNCGLVRGFLSPPASISIKIISMALVIALTMSHRTLPFNISEIRQLSMRTNWKSTLQMLFHPIWLHKQNKLELRAACSQQSSDQTRKRPSSLSWHFEKYIVSKPQIT